MSIAQKSYIEPSVIKEIGKLKKIIPGWAIEAGKRMGLEPVTIRAISNGKRGPTKNRQRELLKVLNQIQKEREAELKKLIA